MTFAVPVSAASFLTVQPVISGSATVSQAFLTNQEAFGDAIFGQINLSITFLTPITAPSLPSIYDGSKANEASTFFGSSSFRNPPVLTVWFVNTITNNGFSDRGLSQQYGVEFGSWIAATGSAAAVNDTLAHEIANDLSDLQETSGSSGSPTYLLEAGTDRNIPSVISQIHRGSIYDQLTAGQAAFLLGNSQFVQGVPEPSSFMLLFGVLAMAAAGACRLRRCFRIDYKNLAETPPVLQAEVFSLDVVA